MSSEAPERSRTAASAVVVGLLLLSTALVTAGAGAASGESPPVELVGVLPNPTAEGDAGERLYLEFAEPTDVSGWTVADGETVVRFPNRTVTGRVIATTDPAAVPAPSNGTVVELSGRLALANAGETIELRGRAGVVATVTYEDAPEGKRYVRGRDGWAWRTPGRTDRPVVTDHDVPARLFVLPDDPTVPLAAIESADERIRLGAYTFASDRVAGALCAARARGVDVEVLVEGEPVGGVTRRQGRALDRLAGCGVPVAVLGGPGDRYGVHHAKYAVVDDRALVITENWKPAGTGGRSSRGWGVLLESSRIADALAETFRADAGYRDARRWEAVRQETAFVDEAVANGSFPTRFEATPVVIDRVALHVTPDNAEAGLVGVIDGAEDRIAIQQVSIGGVEGPFANATLRAARRGVPVRVLLSGAWYVEEDNRRLAERLNRLGRTEGLPIDARLVRPRSRFQKTHTKGLLVDEEVAVVGSLNWNAYAARENREVVVVLTDPDAAAYYGRVFRADWQGGTWRLPIGFGIAVVLGTLAATVLLRRSIEFDDAPTTPAQPVVDGPLG